MTRSFSPNDNNDDLAVIAVKQLAASSSPPAPIMIPYRQAFTYDWLGNLLSVTNGTTSTPVGTMPSILDSLPVTNRQSSVSVTSDSFSYTVPAGGANKLLVVLLAIGADKSSSLAATQNGASLTCRKISGSITRAYHFYCYLASPASGTFSISWSGGTVFQYSIFTLQNAAQSSPIDVSNVTDLTTTGTTLSTNVTTTQGNDLLLDNDIGTGGSVTYSFGTGQTGIFSGSPSDVLGCNTASYKSAASSAGTETMTRTYSPNDNNDDLAVVAVKAAPPAAMPSGMSTTTVYVYGATGWANPDALTSLGNGFSTTTYSYDSNGNLLQAGGWSYMWDYLNRMLASGYNNSTTTYAYDPSGARVLQTSTTSTTYYPNKYYSFTSTKIGANTYATSTNYIWNGDTLLATIDQKLYNGAATGSPITRYIHPDHLGSTNAVTDQNGSLVQLLDYYPYGATRVSTSSYPTNEKRQYIDQFSDAQTGLNYLNARYYNSAQGQFLSEDPVFWEDPKQQNLQDPQSLNVYSYSTNNPITKKDPTGLQVAGGFDDVAAATILARLGAWAIPVVRTALTTGLVSTDAQIASDVYQQANNGKTSINPGSLFNTFVQGLAFGAAAETGAGFISPLAAPFFRTAKTAKVFGQTVSAGSVTFGVDSVNGDLSPWQTTEDVTFSMLSTYGATKIVGVPRGSDVKSFSSPVFFTGNQMSNASRNAATSQGIQSALSSLVSALQGLLVSLQSHQSNSKSK